MTGADVWLWAALALAVINLALLLVLLLSGNKRTHNDETDDSDAPS